jgi:hypothetical protein
MSSCSGASSAAESDTEYQEDDSTQEEGVSRPLAAGRPAKRAKYDGNKSIAERAKEFMDARTGKALQVSTRASRQQQERGLPGKENVQPNKPLLIRRRVSGSVGFKPAPYKVSRGD